MRLALLAATMLAPPLLAASTPAAAQSMPGMTMPMPSASPPSPDRAAPAAHADMTRMAMGSMTGQLAAYPMTRDASGTAWQPDSSPMEGLHGDHGGWSTMLHGYATLDYDDQGGARGDTKTFVESMLMGMAQRPLGDDASGGTLTLRAMGSLDPLMGKSGYPLLLATGETANGRTPLVDRQHPHDLLMELAGAYSRPIAGTLSGFVYVGYPGEPALGPATYMHRFSGLANPEAPIDHHWLDSTHITFGVVTAGLVRGGVKVEASRFTGREPDQHRYNFDRPRFDSWAVRASWNPTRDLALQVSHGHLVSPEQLEPDVDQDRTTASATYDRAFPDGNWQTTFAWGRDASRPGTTTDAFLLESALAKGHHTVFGRAETVGKDELFADVSADPLNGRTFHVGKVSAGYFYTLPAPHHLALDFGGLASRYALPATLRPRYGNPTSFMLFARIKIAP